MNFKRNKLLSITLNIVIITIFLLAFVINTQLLLELKYYYLFITIPMLFLCLTMIISSVIKLLLVISSLIFGRHDNDEVNEYIEKIINKIPETPVLSWQRNGKNYSYTLNRNVIHVHGTTDNSLILGVNDETQIDNKELLNTPQFKEMMVKAESVELMGHLWQREAEKQISKSSFVCILGMSIGQTDAKWWKKLVQWLKANGSRRILLYWFEKNPPESYNTIEQIQCIDKAKEKLLSFTELKPIEKAELKKRISVIINTPKFLKLPKDFSENEDSLDTAG